MSAEVSMTDGKSKMPGRVNIGSSLAIPRAAWWLPGPHLPTIYGKLFRKIPAPATTRAQCQTPDGDTLSIERIRGAESAPRIVIFHGLEGGTHSTYARGVLREAQQRLWWADLVLWRTCDGRLVNDTRRTYHSGASDDAATVIEWILREDPARPTFLFGVSLGGNVMLKWLGERGATVPLAVRGAMAVSVPFDLAAASRKLERGFSSVYTRFFLRKLKAKAQAKLARFPDLADATRVARASTLWEFDDAVTAPVHGYTDAADYYARASSIHFLRDIAVPTVLLNAVNDPFLPPRVLEEVRARAAGNPYIACEFPERGGHVGFVGGARPWRPDYWLDRYAFDRFAEMGGIDH